MMLGGPCSSCCGERCGVEDKPFASAGSQGSWIPSGQWYTPGVNDTVSWSFSEESQNTYFFYGSATTSRPGGGADLASRRDWTNPCNWYTAKTTAPSVFSTVATDLSHRATRVPPADAVVHVYTDVSTESMPGLEAIVSNAYFWGTASLLFGSTITATLPAYDSTGGIVFSRRSYLGDVNSGNSGTINGGATFDLNQLGASVSFTGVVNGGARFLRGAENAGTVSGGAEFYSLGRNLAGAVINGGATFFWGSNQGTVNDSATFFVGGNFGVVNGGALFYGSTSNGDIRTSQSGIVNGGASFYDSSRNAANSVVNGIAIFNDAACSERTVGNPFANPCTRRFVTNSTDLPVCNGTAPPGCRFPLSFCGCG